MKRINIYRLAVVAFVLAVIASAVTYAKATQSHIAESVLRLHVIANSDSDADQKLKIAVRDRVLNEAESLFQNSASAEDAARIAGNNREFLEKAAEDEIRKQGYDYDVRIEVGEFSFPVKFYDDIMLPSGKYRAVRIVIGEGEGRNWWCVMYPPMCSIDGITMSNGSRETLRRSLGEEEYEMISSGSRRAEIRFKIVDIINSII